MTGPSEDDIDDLFRSGSGSDGVEFARRQIRRLQESADVLAGKVGVTPETDSVGDFEDSFRKPSTTDPAEDLRGPLRKLEATINALQAKLAPDTVTDGVSEADFDDLFKRSNVDRNRYTAR